jgi:hypothetical protein
LQAGSVDERSTQEGGGDQENDENGLAHGRGLPALADAIMSFDLPNPQAGQ